MIDFKSQVVIVTGAGRGLGRPGRYARVFIGLGNAWLAEPGSAPSADDIAAHCDQVSATEPFSIPASIFDEVAEICTRRGITS